MKIMIQSIETLLDEITLILTYHNKFAIYEGHEIAN